MSVPMGGYEGVIGGRMADGRFRLGQTNRRDGRYPLVCVCEVPEPEWVYVAHQCRRCWRLIDDLVAL